MKKKQPPRLKRPAGRAGLGSRPESVSRNGAVQEQVDGLREALSKTEQDLRQRTAQLEETSAELEGFMYSVSHDLRAPLRSVRGFSEVLLDRYGPQLDARGQEFLQRCRQAADQMDRLIEALLKLSRVARADLQPRQVNLSDLALSIAAELSQAEPQRAVEWSVAPKLCARGDERLLRVMLEHLLRNAWKFSAKKNPARVEFGRVLEPEPAFFVRDNGTGFDMGSKDRLFGVFQRLHSPNEFPGDGVGLAMVKRILSRHGGRAWASASINRGATFYFALPEG